MTEQASRLIAALADVERHVGSAGWDQPARLFSLVTTQELLELEPQLAEQIHQPASDSLTAIEQDGFASGLDPLERLRQICWPQTVTGAALALERTFLPAEYESEIPEDPGAATQFVMQHPQRVDVRVVVGVLRDGTTHGLARLRSNPEELLGGVDLVPGLTEALSYTLEDHYES